ncbi:MAG TPA: outer membrane protein assembly factor BamD [Polyangiaceae bacterium]|jgi:outer membrane protein assembly factor BamD
MRPASFAAVLFGVAVACGCEGTQPKTALGYTEDAKRAYDAAMEEFNAHSWIEAQTLMREVKRKYSYSKWARQAELRIADADVEQEKFPEAIREYKDFVHAHRSDTEDCIYARAKMAEATYAEIPESFLMPASEERDQAAVVDSYKELRSFLDEYPDAKQARRMRELLANVTARLVRHELYVARFYLRKGNYEAAVARIQYALKNYGEADQAVVTAADAGLKAESLLLLGTTYLKMEKWTEARQAFQALLRSYAQSPLATEARNYLDYLKEKGV